jgi:hypothetical protein
MSCIREGCFMLEVADSTGTRQYDWTNKISVALSPMELATIVEDPDKADGHAFYHDTCACVCAVCWGVWAGGGWGRGARCAWWHLLLDCSGMETALYTHAC